MAEKFKVTGYEAFVQFMKELKTEGKIVNILFTGAKDENVSKFLLFNYYFMKFCFRAFHGVQTVWRLSLSLRKVWKNTEKIRCLCLSTLETGQLKYCFKI